MQRLNHLILGAGLSGLSAAYHLKSNYDIYEASNGPGGVARSFSIDGFTFDRAIHILYTRDDYAASLIRSLLKQNFTEQERSAWIYSHNTYTSYPYQANLAGLPEAIVQENIIALLKARYQTPKPEPRNFEEWILATFGGGIARNFMLPFNQKVWSTDLKNMSYQWIADRVLLPELDGILRGAFGKTDTDLGPNAFFWYPRHGGIQALTDAFVEQINPIRINDPCTGIDVMRRIAYFEHSVPRSYDRLISTIPLPALVKLLNPLPIEVAHAASLLRSNRVITVNLGIDHDDISEKHWIYFPESEFEFHRVSFPGNFSRDLVPRGKSSITVEYSTSPERPLQVRGLLRRTISALERANILHPGDRILCSQIDVIDPAYVIPTLNAGQAKQMIQSFLQSHGIFSYGRFGNWSYINMDQAILEGKRASESAESNIEILSTVAEAL